MKLTIELTDQEYADLLAFAKLKATFNEPNMWRSQKMAAVDAILEPALKAIRQARYSEITKEFSHD